MGNVSATALESARQHIIDLGDGLSPAVFAAKGASQLDARRAASDAAWYAAQAVSLESGYLLRLGEPA